MWEVGLLNYVFMSITISINGEYCSPLPIAHKTSPPIGQDGTIIALKKKRYLLA